MQKVKRAITRAVTNDIRPFKSPTHDPWTLEPDDLRNQVQRALSTLCEPDHKMFRRRLITGLAKSGVQIGSSLFMLGISAACLDDLTPSDMGKLLRYIRINTPAAIEAIAGPLAELLVVKEEPALTARKIDEAA
jgi:hypothetical protein